MILAIDPGPVESAWVLLGGELEPIEFAKQENKLVLAKIEALRYWPDDFAIEMVASYGMAVGKEVFETCVWIGRFCQAAFMDRQQYIYRKDEKMNLCHTMKAKDSNIRQALMDRFGAVGTKKAPGWFYGFSGDIWQAYAVGVTYHDLYIAGKETEKKPEFEGQEEFA